jgi:hypothetical protein
LFEAPRQIVDEAKREADQDVGGNDHGAVAVLTRVVFELPKI